MEQEDKIFLAVFIGMLGLLFSIVADSEFLVVIFSFITLGTTSLAAILGNQKNRS
jgi:hypothetical protein